MIKTGIFPFLTLTISTAFLIVFVYGASYGLQLVDQDIKKGISVAGISISELPKNVAKEKIDTEIEKWRETRMVSFHYQDKEVHTSAAELFFYDIDKTLRNSGNESAWPLHLFVNDDDIDNILQEIINTEVISQLDRQLLDEDIHLYGQSLRTEDLIVNVHDYLSEATEVIATAEITNLYKTNELIEAALFFDGLRFTAKQQFSFSEILRENQNDSINDQIYSIIATTLYQLVLETNLELNERHISEILPTYSEVGLEARVDRDKDLKIFNPNATSYIVNFQLEKDSLRGILSGIPFTDTYRIKLSNHETTEFEKNIETDLTIEGKKIIQQGQIGQEITVHRVRSSEDGQSKEQLISEDQYAPVPSVEVHGRESGDEFDGIKGY